MWLLGGKSTIHTRHNSGQQQNFSTASVPMERW